MMKNTRCLFQKRARTKVLKRLEGLRQKLVGTNEDSLYMRDLIFEIQILRCKDCKVIVYQDGSWVTEYCNQHFKENEHL